MAPYINMKDICLALIVMALVSDAFAEASLEVRWKYGEVTENKINQIEFVLDSDEAIYGVQIEGSISKEWLKGVKTDNSFYVPLGEGNFFNTSKPAVINSSVNKQTGDFSYISSLIGPAKAMDNNEVIFTLPVKPLIEVLPNVSFKTLKLARKDGSVFVIKDVNIDKLIVGEKPWVIQQYEVVAFAATTITLCIMFLLFYRKRNKMQPVTN